VHGLKDVEKGGKVIISAKLEGETIRFSVSDSGCGMSSEYITLALAAARPDDTRPQNGIGLHNVVRRVALATGGLGRVEIESKLGHGTCVTILLPTGKTS
jgi:sensor histidine kinase YesM